MNRLYPKSLRPAGHRIPVAILGGAIPFASLPWLYPLATALVVMLLIDFALYLIAKALLTYDLWRRTISLEKQSRPLQPAVVEESEHSSAV
jgi:hypothetical protein